MAAQTQQLRVEKEELLGRNTLLESLLKVATQVQINRNFDRLFPWFLSRVFDNDVFSTIYMPSILGQYMHIHACTLLYMHRFQEALLHICKPIHTNGAHCDYASNHQTGMSRQS